jgi:hypothetical protein
MPRNLQQELRDVTQEIAAAQARLHSLLEAWSAQTEHDRLEWLRALRHAEHRADHAERHCHAAEAALMSLP